MNLFDVLYLRATDFQKGRFFLQKDLEFVNKLLNIEFSNIYCEEDFLEHISNDDKVMKLINKFNLEIDV